MHGFQKKEEMCTTEWQTSDGQSAEDSLSCGAEQTFGNAIQIILPKSS